MPLKELRDDMCSLQPKLPIIRKDWIKFDIAEYDEGGEEKIVAMCPLCTLAVEQELITEERLIEIFNVGRTSDVIYELISQKYDIFQSTAADFVNAWDSSGLPLDMSSACQIVDKIIDFNSRFQDNPQNGSDRES